MTEHIEYIIPAGLIIIILIVGIYMVWQKNKIKEYQINQNNIPLDNIEPTRYDKIPGILMSIGIIGTFYLIYSGLHSIPDGLDITKVLVVIKDKIAPAFLVSAGGIGISIIYLIFESILASNFNKKIEKFKEENNAFTFAHLATQDLETSKNILKAINKQTETFSSLGKFADGLGDVTASMELFSEIAEKLDKTLNPEELGKVISTALLKEMTPVLNNIQSITSNVDTNSKKITQFLEDDLKNEIITPLKEAVLSTDKSMQEMRKVLKSTSDVMNETSKGIKQISINLSQLETSQTEFVKNLDEVLDKQKSEFENTTKIIENTYTNLNSTVNNQTSKFEENSNIILKSFTRLSIDMKGFLEDYKEDYKVILDEQQKAIIETKDSAVEILNKSGEEASSLINTASTSLNETLSKAGDILDKSGQGVADVISMASDKLDSTLSGVDEALVKTSKSIKDELEKFKDSYTDTLKGFLDSQEKILDKVFKEQTERLAGVVDGFRNNLEADVENRKLLNTELDELIKKTNGFVSSTKASISTAFDAQQSQLEEFLKTNQTMKNKLYNMIDDLSRINENGNNLTQELIDTTAKLQKQFNDNQAEILERYQGKVDKHLEDILKYMAAIIEASYIDKDK